ncbi:SH3 domain-containing protein [Listeria rocourtiae]|uniref:SH3 domain-containing protein n=2 Tax=Listeria rocourtiae TaxID=647910 RepID=A0A4R6ZKZ1_9LIST|nr:SH3 domain-containing protein [Listeria rocourtiae]
MTFKSRTKCMSLLLVIVLAVSVFILPKSGEAATTYKMTTTVESNIRTGDSVKYAIIGYYKAGTTVTFNAKTKNNWYRITYKGKVGYVSGKCLAPYKAQSFTALNTEAKKHLGKKYKWGATGPTSFDCSGYTSYVFKQSINKAIPRTAKQQYSASTKIKANQLKEGDLVFFNYGSGIAHVGIYVGSGKMINAQNNGVKYDNISSGYWKRYIAGYGRVVNF